MERATTDILEPVTDEERLAAILQAEQVAEDLRQAADFATQLRDTLIADAVEMGPRGTASDIARSLGVDRSAVNRYRDKARRPVEPSKLTGERWARWDGYEAVLVDGWAIVERLGDLVALLYEPDGQGTYADETPFTRYLDHLAEVDVDHYHKLMDAQIDRERQRLGLPPV